MALQSYLKCRSVPEPPPRSEAVPPDLRPEFDRLTERQYQTLWYAAHGLTAQATAQILMIRPSTVNGHLKDGRARLNLSADDARQIILAMIGDWPLNQSELEFAA